MTNRINRTVIALLAGVFLFAGCENEPTKTTISPGETKIVEVETYIFGAEDDLDCSAKLESVNFDAMDVNLQDSWASGSDCYAQVKISVHEDTTVGVYSFEVEFIANYEDSDGNRETETKSETVEVNVK